MPGTSISIAGTARTFMWLCFDVVASWLGPAIVETALNRLIPSGSAAAIIGKEWALSVLLAGGFGFLAYRIWRSNTHRVSWIVFLVWFLFGVFLLERRAHPASIADFWIQVSGIECAASLRAADCQTFFLFTVPLVRGLAYSAGALFGARILRPAPVPAGG